MAEAYRVVRDAAAAARVVVEPWSSVADTRVAAVADGAVDPAVMPQPVPPGLSPGQLSGYGERP